METPRAAIIQRKARTFNHQLLVVDAVVQAHLDQVEYPQKKGRLGMGRHRGSGFEMTTAGEPGNRVAHGRGWSRKSIAHRGSIS
jgi:hypothetical protein